MITYEPETPYEEVMEFEEVDRIFILDRGRCFCGGDVYDLFWPGDISPTLDFLGEA